MRRVTVLATCALILPVLGRGEVGPASKPAKADPSLAARLAKRADFGGIDDPKTTLAEALDALAKLYDVNFDVNEKAFKFDQVNEVLKTMTARSPAALTAVKDYLRSAPMMEPRGAAAYGVALLSGVLTSAAHK